MSVKSFITLLTHKGNKAELKSVVILAGLRSLWHLGLSGIAEPVSVFMCTIACTHQYVCMRVGEATPGWRDCMYCLSH